LFLADRTSGFLPGSRLYSSKAVSRTSACWNSRLFSPDEDFDGDGRKRDDQSGEALAKAFYDQVRKREQKQASSPETAAVTDSNDIELYPTTTAPKKKFTGKPETSPFRSNAAASFGDRSQQRRSPREQMMEREFQLVGRAEKGLAFQAGLAFCVLCLYVYVGLTEGIQSETTDFIMGDDDDEIEIVMPERRDTESSYWL
jgi:hypothetical protein